MNDDDFINDPIFQQLKAFSAADEGGQTMPSNIRQGFRDGIRTAKKRRFAWRGALGAGLIIIAFPTLAAAKILPHPIQHFVESVNRVVAAPVHKLIKISTTHHVVIRNTDNKRVQMSRRNRDNFSPGPELVVLPTQAGNPSFQVGIPSQQTGNPREQANNPGEQVNKPGERGILNSLGKTIAPANPRSTLRARVGKDGGRRNGQESPPGPPATQLHNEIGTLITTPASALPSQVSTGKLDHTLKKSPPSNNPRGGSGKGFDHKPAK